MPLPLAGSPATPPSWPSEALAAAVPAGLLQRARSSPNLAIRLLSRGHLDDPVLTMVLRAVVQIRRGRLDAAASEAIGAALTAVHETPADPVRELTARAVLADTTCCQGNPAAVHACRSYLAWAMQHGVPRQVVLAEALHAVAVFHRQDCDRGRELLHGAQIRYRREHGAGDPVDRMLAGGLAAMAEHCGCPPSELPPITTPLDPMPAGVWPAGQDEPPERGLADRVRAHLCAHRRNPRTRGLQDPSPNLGRPPALGLSWPGPNNKGG